MKQIFYIISLFTICAGAQAQNVGIGTTTPTSPLTIKTDNIGVSQESQDGSAKVGFYTSANSAFVQTHSNTNLQFSTGNGGPQMTLQKTTGNVGINNPSPAAKLDVKGNFKLSDGTQGANKVLTSDANGNAAWKDAAFGNTERFEFVISDQGSADTVYNLGTTTGTLNGSHFDITISKSGLYHFDLSMNSEVDYSSTDENFDYSFLHLELDVFISNNYHFCRGYAPFTNSPAGFDTRCYSSYDKSFERYFVAGEICTFNGGTIQGLANPKPIHNYTYLNITGHLIAP